MDPRPAALLLLAIPGVGCTVLNDLDGYAGGTRDTGSAVGDTGKVADSSAQPDSFAPAEDTFVPPADTTVAAETTSDTGTAMMPDTAVVDSAMPETADVGTCGAAYVGFGLSEFQVRGTFGIGDKREWIELTNYGATALDVSGVTVKVFSSSTERASALIPGGTTLMPGASLVVAGDRAVFSADVMASFGLGTVLEFMKNDYLVNGAASEVRLFGPGCATPYETAIIPAKTYSIGQPWAYPPPSPTCPASARLMAGGALGAAWKEVPTTTTPYGSYTTDAGVQSLYGTPTKPNNVACP